MNNKKTLNFSGQIIDLRSPKVMGIINTTPDSFYKNSRHSSVKSSLDEAEKMLHDGAEFLDVGGYSSRPGAAKVSVKEEIKRTETVISEITREFPNAIISIDTFRTAVAEPALNAGARMINDISGGQLDDEMFDLVSKWGCPYILMHMKGDPSNMMDFCTYDDLLKEITEYFVCKIQLMRQKGIKDIIIDPGFGFSKDIDQNYELLRKLAHLQILDVPVLSGISRKSMIYKKLGITSQEALNGTTVLNTISLMKGASILRVHDVKEAAQTIELYKETFT